MSTNNSDQKSISSRVTDTEAPQLIKYMRYLNLCNAVGIVAAGVLYFLFSGASLNLNGVISAVYVCLFGCLFLVFETRIATLEAVIMENVGFMFRWQGRLLFFTFIGTLLLGLGIIGYIVGGLTFAVVIFNLYVMCKNKEYYAQMRANQAALVATAHNAQASGRTVGDDFAKTMALGQVAVSIASDPVARQVAQTAMSASNAMGNELDNDPNWEKNLDEHSGQYFYFNKLTSETRWVE